MSDAVADLKFLSDRFKGILDLSDKFGSYKALENQSKEMANTVDETKAAIEKLNEEKSSVNSEIEALKSERAKQISMTEASLKDLAVKAERDAAAIKSNAETYAKNLTVSAEETLKDLDAKIKSKRNELLEVNKDVDVQYVKLHQFKDELNSIKAKL